MWPTTSAMNKPVRMIRQLLFISIVLNFTSGVQAQDCFRNLQDARRDYINGNFERVISLLSPCADLTGEDQKEALELLINSNLILDHHDQADQYMMNLLQAFPLYQDRPSDLIEFQHLFESYEIRTKYNLGAYIGFNSPSFSVLQYRSVSSITEEPDAYNTSIGTLYGVNGSWLFYKDYFLSGGIFLQQFNYNQSEIILTFQEVSIAEKLTYISTPIQIGYQISRPSTDYFAQAGISINFLLESEARLELFGIDPDITTPLTGIPRKADSYSLTQQRRPVTFSYVVSAGIRRHIGLISIEIGLHYEIGLNNLVSEKNRFANEDAYRTYSYVSDDFKMNHLRVTAGFTKRIVYPKKKMK